MGSRICDSNLLAIENSWCSTTLHPLLGTSLLVKTCLQNPCTSCAPFSSWPLPFPTSVASLHQVVWPWALPHLHHLHHLGVTRPKLWAQSVTCPSPFERGWPPLPNAPNCCSKTRPTLNGSPNIVNLPPHNSLGIVGWLSSPSRFVHPFGVERMCSSWILTPCTSIGLAKTCPWTLGLDLKLCPLGGHDA
jgi:hypothetical protein